MVDESGGGEEGLGKALVEKVLAVGVDGIGPLKGAQELAEEHLQQHGDPDVAVRKFIATHARMVGATGAAMGLGGLITLPVTIPTDVLTFYALSSRCAAGVAYLRGYDIQSDEVRSVVLLTLLGSGGVATAAEIGIQLGNKTALVALRKLPGSVLIAINRQVGFRLVTKFGEKGVVNLWKLVPFVGAGVGALVNVLAMRSVGGYAKSNFPKT